MYDIFYVERTPIDSFLPARTVENARLEDMIAEAKKKSNTDMFWIIYNGVDETSIDFNYSVPEWDKKYIHVWKSTTEKYCAYLCNGYHQELKMMGVIPINDATYDSMQLKYNAFIMDMTSSLDDMIADAKSKSKTKFFWLINPNVETMDLTYNIPFHDEHYVHVWDTKNSKYPYGVILTNGEKGEIKHMGEIKNLQTDILFLKSIKPDKPTSYWRDLKRKHDGHVYFMVDNGPFEELVERFVPRAKSELFYVVRKDFDASDFEFNHDIESWDTKYTQIWKEKDSTTTFDIPVVYMVNKNDYDLEKTNEVEVVQSKNYDVFFLSYNEPNADENYQHLLSICPYAKRVDGVKGILEAHRECAIQSETEMFYVVDGDSKVKESFDFGYKPPVGEREYVYTWRAMNPLNKLIYGNGGLKLLPRYLLLEQDDNYVDMTTTLTKDFKLMDDVASTTHFNSSAFNTWKAAFRECAKLSSKIIDGQLDQDSEFRLYIWCKKANGMYEDYCLNGAQYGKLYGEKNKDDIEAMKKINDFDWLYEEWSKHAN